MAKKLQHELKIGYSFRDKFIKDVTLMRINAVAEKIFVNKIQDKPYTYMAYILAAGIKSLNDIQVGENARKEYHKTGTITIPPVILAMPLAEVNTLLVEIHRNLWKRKVDNQESICKYCGKSFLTDIDLDRIAWSEEDLQRLQEREDWSRLWVNLEEDGFEYKAPALPNNAENPLAEFNGVYNTFSFKLPTLGACIANEAYSDDNILFWQRVALDSLVAITDTDEHGGVIRELPPSAWKPFGLRIFEHIYREDAASIRDGIRDTVPSLPFYYEDICPCPQRRTVPVSMEGSNFFSE